MIKFVVFDFDGVFTDGKILFDSQGNICKSYNVIDGTGLKLLGDIKIGVISGYKENLSQRKILEHLNIEYISLGFNNKLDILKKWCDSLEINLNEVAYMGDDINDIDILTNVELGGCPLNAHKSCKKICNFISIKNGGDGCVREFCEYIINIYNLKINEEDSFYIYSNESIEL